MEYSLAQPVKKQLMSSRWIRAGQANCGKDDDGLFGLKSAG
jgi:hypothetical protein